MTSDVSQRTARTARSKVRASATVDECFDRLHRAGWSIGEVPTQSGWRVSGTNGENVLDVVGWTQAEAWRRACEAAWAVRAARTKRLMGLDRHPQRRRHRIPWMLSASSISC